MEEYDERITYRIGVQEVWKSGEHRKYWFVNVTGAIPMEQEPPRQNNPCLADAAKNVANHFKCLRRKGTELNLLAASSETTYQIRPTNCRLSRPPTAEEMKQLGEEVMTALKGG